MRLSDGVEWGVHVCTLLATLPADGALPAAKLAEFHDVPAAYLAKHLQALARAGVLQTAKGPRGGYRLSRPPAEITILDVVEAIDGDEPAFRCTEIRRRGPTAMPARYYPRPCGIHAAFDRADEVWRACVEGRSGIVRLQGIDTGGLKSSVAAQVLDFDPASVMDPVELRRVPRMIPLAMAASREALASAGVEIDPDDVETDRDAVGP